MFHHVDTDYLDVCTEIAHTLCNQNDFIARLSSERVAMMLSEKGIRSRCKSCRREFRTSKIPLDSEIDGKNTAVLSLLAELRKAQFDLEQTTVRANWLCHSISSSPRRDGRSSSSRTRYDLCLH